MQAYLPQFLCQVHHAAREKCVRLAIKSMPQQVGDYGYPCVRRNREWLENNSVEMTELPESVYQVQEVCGDAGVDYQDRFTPEHCYPFCLTTKAGKVAEMIINQALHTASCEPIVTYWKRAGVIKRQHEAEDYDKVYEGVITLFSPRFSPAVDHKMPYALRGFTVDAEVLALEESDQLCLRLDRKRLELETRPRYLQYMAKKLEQPALPRVESLVVKPDCSKAALLAFARDIQTTPSTESGSSRLDLVRQAYLTDFSAHIKNVLLSLDTQNPPIARLIRPLNLSRPNNLTFRIEPSSGLRLNTLYLVELSTDSRSQRSCGVTQLLEDNRAALVLQAKPQQETIIVVSCWTVERLVKTVREFEALPEAARHVGRCGLGEDTDAKALLRHMRGCVRI